MKIGILTFHRSYNYGAFMQCWSLVQKLKADLPGSEVEVIDYMFNDNDGYHRQENEASGEMKSHLLARNRAIESVAEYLPLSKERFIGADYERLYEKIGSAYDVIVVGSDAVFNWNGKGLPNAFMPVDVDARLVSYAASSHGLDFFKADRAALDTAAKAFSHFSYLGVRDDETAKLIEYTGCGKTAHHNCDPTVLLKLDELPVDMNALADKLQRRGINLGKPLVGIMASEPIGRGMKEHFGGKVQTAALYQPNRYADFFLDDLNPFEWARVFSFFSMTITHFFHGTMLSLKNEKNTLITEPISDYTRNHDTKIVDFLKRTGLQNFYYPMDIARDTLVKRAMFKAGISDRKYRQGIYSRMEEILAHPCQPGLISGQLKEEGKHYNGFIDSIKSL